MKRLLIFLALMMSFALMNACDNQTTTTNTTVPTTITTTTQSTVTTQPITTTEEPTTTTITTLESLDLSVDDLDGEGTIDSPYNVYATVDETFTKTINYHVLSGHLVYEEGVIVNQTFYPIEDEQYKTLDFEGANDFSMVLYSAAIGTFFVRVSMDNRVPTYFRVVVQEYQVDMTKNLKVLAIGNSFSVDAMEYLYKIAEEYGIPNITLGVLYIGGASLATHVSAITSNSASYVYYKNTNDNWYYAKSSATLLDGLLDEKWDIITIQQVSGYSGLPTTYNEDIDTIINFVNTNKTNEKAEIVWHMTWAYQQGSTHSDFYRYNNDQMTMYNAITSTVQEKIVPRTDIAYVIPSGTAIQNLRTSFLGDTLTRDGYHLSYDIGRYTAGMMWFRQITGFSIDDITYLPGSMNNQQLLALKQAVNNAYDTPYAITQSTFTTT